ncbi:IS1595 family transposase [Xanthomonas citri]|uniref:IS1595 family transposase n=1 Tax=Xanthomonas citri TaxID=346 RepID=UPI0022B3F335|nr:IS1595 family transposase [Xanthomonas citri]
MSINAVQFQAGLSMPDFFAAYGTEAKCYRALYRWRWPQGFRCPCCAGRARSRFKRGGAIYYQCSACRHQTSLIAGTMFQGTKLSLRTWMLALHLLTSTKTNMAALELMRHLGVNYKTAWRMKHKIMQVMAEREATRRLSGFVQIDDAYLGGERNGGKAGRGSENKQPFLIAVQTDASFTAPSFVVIEPVRSFDNAALTDWIARRLKPECEAYTDGLACFQDAGHAHTTLDTGGARWVWCKRHQRRLRRKAERYLAEAAYRFNRRFRLPEMLPRLATAMMRCKPCPEPALRMAGNFHG